MAIRQGTGLPGGTAGGSLTPLADFSGSAGIGERAAAEALERVSRITESAFEEFVMPNLQEAAAQQAEADAAAGRFERRMAITGVGREYNRALERGAAAKFDNDIERELDALRVANPFDPDAFQQQAEARRAALIEQSPEWLVGNVAQTFDRRATANLGAIQSARAERDLTEARNGIDARLDRLVSEAVAFGQTTDFATALNSDQVQGNILQVRLLIDELESNPAFGLSSEEALAKREEITGRLKAGLIAQDALQALRTGGADAALARVQSLVADPEMALTPQERQLAVAQATEAVQRETQLERARANLAAEEENRRQRELNRMIEEDAASIELGEGGIGLTEEQVRQMGGAPAVARWYRARADAAEFNGLVGDLSGLSPEAAAERILTRTAARGFNAMPVVAGDEDLDALTNAVIQVESGGRTGLVSADPDGPGPAGGGAVGIMQLLPETAQRMAERLGVPYDRNRLLNDADYGRQLGQAYLSELLDRYNGDTFLAVTAYHAGPGNVDGWLRSVGDPRSGSITREAWLDGVEARGNPRSAEYPRKVLEALNGGRATRAWDAYRGQRQAQRNDPAGSVLRDTAVRAAGQAWASRVQQLQANGGRAVSAAREGEAYVSALLSAQDRAGVRQGDRRALPVNMLVRYAGELERYEQANDMESWRAVSQDIVRQFGRYGDRVLQDVLEIGGSTRYASQVAAAATRSAATGAAPPRPAEVQTAQRTQAIAGAATGQRPAVRQMSDEEVLRAAGLQ
ncbi:MAG TPA: transglycosylase SLT domain-containing protein [Brevundimonas sp.]|jgi:soluble lytic murein transglycosylase|uniref:transglycosylase SLT domain-containing protein n=1 Tax=Brevundimonas sp. TaxID=1871086 RepID=UPI002E13749D|nr:transglycosylase SLT domain-containing protein [Brevundimonas sp.]